jgi:putative Holliday junction resolvase
MKILAIDYGGKRIGLATSDDTGTVAFPRAIIPNDDGALRRILDMIQEEHISEIVVGESTDYRHVPNPIMKKINDVIDVLKERTRIPIYLEWEVLTSSEARRGRESRINIDAAAAAILLQTFLDRRRNTKDV